MTQDADRTDAGTLEMPVARHCFPNRAGNHADTDDVLTAELEKAGIAFEKHEFLRLRNNEVKTAVIGSLHGWCFERAWYYWVASGPGIELEAAEKLHADHGRSVRVAGHCCCPSPGEWYKGLACGSYHVEDQEGLNALADTIRKLVARWTSGTKQPQEPEKPDPTPRQPDVWTPYIDQNPYIGPRCCRDCGTTFQDTTGQDRCPACTSNRSTIPGREGMHSINPSDDRAWRPAKETTRT